MLALPLSPFLRYNPKLPRRSIDPREISYCVNCEIKDGGIVVSSGLTILPGLSTYEPVRHIAEHVSNNGTRFLCLLTEHSFFVYNTSTGVLSDYTRTGDNYGGSYQWSSCSYGNYFIFSNGVDEVQMWDSTTIVDADDFAITGLTSWRPKLVMTFGAHFIMACDNAATDTVDYKAVVWSTAGTPEAFPLTGSSGQLYVYEGKGAVNGIATLTRDTIAIYKSDSIHLLEYVGAPGYFNTRSAISGVGISFQDSIVQVGNEHIVLTNNGLKKYDGSTVQPFAPEITPVLAQYFPNNNKQYAKLLFDGYENKLWVFLPNSGTTWEFTSALVYGFLDASWSRQTGLNSYAVGTANIAPSAETRWSDLGISWDHATAASLFWGAHSVSEKIRLLVADTTSSVWWKDDLSSTRFGDTYIATAETMLVCPGFLLFQSPTWNTELVQVDVGVAAGNPDVFVGVSDKGDETIAWHGPYTPDANGIVYTTIVGRWFIIRVQSTSSFNVSSLTAWYVKRGSL